MLPKQPNPEWQIDFEEYLQRLDLTENGFRSRLGLPSIKMVKKVLPLKDIKNISSVVPINRELLDRLLRSIKTLDGQFPFQKAQFEMLKFDPMQLQIGQKFAYRENYVQLLEDLSDIFAKRYAINPGISTLGAYMIFGESSTGEGAIAYYLPPIVEKHNNNLVIMDGIHRNYITLKVGGTVYAILARDVVIPFPCSGKNWNEIKVISLAEKPKDINERYFDLRKNLFRDLKYLGIDG